MKKIILILIIVVAIIGGVWYWDYQQRQTLNDAAKALGWTLTEMPGRMTKVEAKAIAEKSCIKGGESLGRAYYDPNSRTWWFDANLNSATKLCRPACVVSEETKKAEINGRCMGLIED